MTAVRRGAAWWPLCRFAVLLAWVAIIAGCASSPGPQALPAPAPPAPAAPMPGVRDGVLIHTWTPTSAPPADAWAGPRTQLYTYVLCGDAGGNDGDGGSPMRAQAHAALAGLLREIQASQRAASVADGALLAQANQFVLPARGYAHGAFELRHYDFALAADHLNRARLVLSAAEYGRRLAGLGPFFVATRKPLGELVQPAPGGGWALDTASPVLLVDMTGAHPKAMAAYVNSYKTAVRETLPEQTASLQPLRARFASAVLRLAEAVPFVAEAYASTSRLLHAPASDGGATQ